MITTEQKLAALRDARNVLDSSAGLSRQMFCTITVLDAIIVDLEHLPALVNVLEAYTQMAKWDMEHSRRTNEHDDELYQRGIAALAHFTEAGGQGGEDER